MVGGVRGGSWFGKWDWVGGGDGRVGVGASASRGFNLLASRTVTLASKITLRYSVHMRKLS